MGISLTALCGACGYGEDDLKLGATHEEIAQHDVCTREVYVVSCCTRVTSLLLFLGQPLPTDLSCPRCAQSLDLASSQRLSISKLSGVALEGHSCPKCAEPRLNLTETGRFV